MNTSTKLIFLCGKMAAGKSTLASDLAKRENAILLVQDDFLNALFLGEITDIPTRALPKTIHETGSSNASNKTEDCHEI